MIDSAEDAKVDPWIIFAIIHTESRWHAGALRHESDGTCSVGLGQINSSCDPVRVGLLQDPLINITRVGKYLVRSKEYCRQPKVKCRRGWLGLYNPGDPHYPDKIRKVAKAHGSPPKKHSGR